MYCNYNIIIRLWRPFFRHDNKPDDLSHAVCYDVYFYGLAEFFADCLAI